jgi:SET domain-containing protein
MQVPDGLEIRESPIHGLGLFATRHIRKGERLGEYIGTEMLYKDFKTLYGNDFEHTYIKKMIYKPWVIRVAKGENRNYMTYINDGAYGQTVSKVNVYLKKWFLYAWSDIEPGEELLLEYMQSLYKK